MALELPVAATDVKVMVVSLLYDGVSGVSPPAPSGTPLFTVTVNTLFLTTSASGALATSGAGESALDRVTDMAVAVGAGAAVAPLTSGPLNPAAMQAATARTRSGRRRVRTTGMVVDLRQQ